MSSAHDIRPDSYFDRPAASGKRQVSGAGNSQRKFDFVTLSIVGLIVAALGFSGYLSWAALTSNSVAGCDGSQIFDCGHVLQTKWSKVFGIPVGVPAVGLYLAALVAFTVSKFGSTEKIRKSAYGLLAFASLTAAVAALWFISLQIFVVEHLCQYCLAAHCCGLVLAAIVFYNSSLTKTRLFGTASMSLASVAILALGQILAEPPQSYVLENHTTTDAPASVSGSEDLFSAPGTDVEVSEGELFSAPGTPDVSTLQRARKKAPSNFALNAIQLLSGNVGLVTLKKQSNSTQQSTAEDEKEASTTDQNAGGKGAAGKSRTIGIQGGSVRLAVEQWPLVGRRDAGDVLVEMFDYTCPTCRANHKSIAGAMDKLGEDQIAFIALAIPMNSDCNSTVSKTNPKAVQACELAKLATAVWRVDPEKFGAYHNWLFQGDVPPTTESAKTRAEGLVGRQKLDAELSGGVVDAYIAKQVQLYQSIGAGTVPKLLFANTTVSGKVGTTDSLVALIKQQATQR